MKKMMLLFMTLLITSVMSFAQSVGINTDNSAPDNSAMLDVKSDAKGFLLPRLTKVQRKAITIPAIGLMVYQTNDTAGFYYYDGSSWQLLGTAGSAAGSNGQLTFNHSGVADGATSLFYDNVDSRLGIGTTTPAATLDVNSISAVESVDQSQTNTSGLMNIVFSANATIVGQSFTVGITGPLNKIGFDITEVGVGTVTFKLYSGGISGQAPIGPEVFSKSGLVLSAGWNYIDLTTPVHVNVGDEYTFQIIADYQIKIPTPNSNVYAGGRMLYSSSYDMIFETYVSAPGSAFVVTSSGNVGVGTSSPERPLHIKDLMRLVPRTTAPNDPSEGDIYFDGTTHKLMVYDGSAWQACW
jgi:hypothetical protein